MGCSLVSAITFMSNKRSRKIQAYYFGCILVRFGRVSCRTDGTRSWEPQGLPRASEQVLTEHVSPPSRKKEHCPAPVACTLAVTTQGLTAFTSRMTASCSICSMLELPGSVLHSCFLSSWAPDFCGFVPSQLQGFPFAFTELCRAPVRPFTQFVEVLKLWFPE